MTTSQYLLNAGLLGYILYSNLGTRRLTAQRFLLPVLLVAIAGFVFLKDLPTAGNDVALEIAGAGLGVGFGLLAAALVRVHRAPNGQLMATAGAAYAALWIAVIGGRMLFAYGADHWFTASIVRFSMTHQITGGDAWTAAFVLMALTMVLTRVAVTAVVAARQGSAAHPSAFAVQAPVA